MRNSHSAIWAVLLAFLPGVVWQAQSEAASYFVAPAGNDASNGSQAAPFRTIARGLSVAGPGDVVYLRGGIYKERVTFPRSGGDQKITLRNFAGEEAILDADGVPGQHIIYIRNLWGIRIEGLILRNNVGVKDGSIIRIEGWANTIEIVGNKLLRARGKDAMAITAYGTDRSAPIEKLLIERNTIEDIRPGQSETVTLNGNVRNFIIAENLIRDVKNIGIDFIGGEGVCSNRKNDRARNGICRRNMVVRANSTYGGGYAAGIYVDGGDNIIIENNVVTQCDLGIEVGAENAGQTSTGIQVRNNIVYKNEKCGIIFGGFEESVGRVRNCSFTGNTLFSNDTLHTGLGEICIQWASGNTLRNNIVFANSQRVMLYSEEGNGNNALDYNLYFCSGGESAAEFVWRGESFEGLEAFQEETGQDPHSIFANPKFKNSRRGDFHIAKSSKAINAGDPRYRMKAGEEDLDGEKRKRGRRVDAGADEVR